MELDILSPEFRAAGSIEKVNRRNFRAALQALSRPGTRERIQPLFDSSILAMASMLLYSEVTHCYRGQLKDFQLIRAMTGSRPHEPNRSDYLFADQPDPLLLAQAFAGTMEEPELAATCIFRTPQGNNNGVPVFLRGPGIDKTLETSLPLPRGFVEQLLDKQYPYPMGIDLFLLTADDRLIGLPRTTKIEIIS